jgi:hypothetical protein
MRLMVCRWGVVVAILGLPVLGRGLATATPLPIALGIVMMIVGGSLFVAGRIVHPPL